MKRCCCGLEHGLVTLFVSWIVLAASAIPAHADVERMLEAEQSGRTDTFYAAGFDASWEIDLFGRIRSNIEAQDALTEQALVSYEQTMLFALQDVEDAMVSYVQEDALAESEGLVTQNLIRIDRALGGGWSP